MKTNARGGLVRLTVLAMLSALSVVLVLVTRFPIFPAAPYLVYDMADVPVLIATMLYGPLSGFAVLAVVSTIQAFALSADGWVGLVMHLCASGALVWVSGLIYRARPKTSGMILGLILGSLAMTALMVPLNFVFTVNFYGTPFEFVRDAMFPFIIPFNLIKSFGNSAIAFVVSVPVLRYVMKMRQ